MKNFYITLLTILLLICPAVTVIASPAYPGLVIKKQPDGTTISLYLVGDEKVHRMESEDGYSLLYNNNHVIVYAVSDEAGDLVPSSVPARDVSLRSSSDQSFLKGIPKKLNFSPSQISTAKNIWTMVQSAKGNDNSNRFRAGTVTRAICTLVNFSNKSMAKTSTVAAFNNLMNQVGYGSSSGDKGSVHDFFVENSYGKVDLEITVAGPYTLSKACSYYGANDSTKTPPQDYISRLTEFGKEAANLTFNDASINPNDYDNDGDGVIDAFHIIYAGYGEESGGADTCIWAHENPNISLKFGSKMLEQYSCSPELRGNFGTNITHIGVICHEMGHIFGSPDFYDTDYEGSGGNFLGTGKWDLMGGGSWNNAGACPAHINMYQKIKMGWVTPVTLSSAQAITGMLNSAKNAVAYLYNTTTPGEYYVLENRQQTGFDTYIPGHGLLIWHAGVITNSDLLSNMLNAGSPQKMYPVCASATGNPSGTPASYGNINSEGCPYPGSSGNTSFTDYTVPAATSWKGANTLKPVTEIQEKNSAVSFNFMMPNAVPVTNLQTTVSGQSVKLTWTKPTDNTVIGYNIYRDNVLLISLLGKDATSYIQYNVSSGTYNYCVTALYTGKESTPVCRSVIISGSSAGGSNYLTVQNLTAQNVNGNKDIQLKWQTPFVNSWMTFADSLVFLAYLDDPITQFSAVVRFTTDDLQKFQGSSLTKVRFALGNLNCKYSLQVWYVNPDTIQAWLSGKDVVSLTGAPIVNQAVTNPSKTNGNFEVTLNSPVPLVPNKEIWIGIQYILNPMKPVAGIDAGPMVADYKNFTYFGGNWYPMDPTQPNAANWYIAGWMDFGSAALKAPPADNWLRATTAETATGSNYIVYRDNKQIAIPTQSTYTDSNVSAGNHIYCVSIKYSDGTESEQVCVQAVSLNYNAIAPVNPDGEINIYPNPVNKGETLIIRCDPQTNSTLSIYSISGQLLKQEQVIGPDVSEKMDYDPGIYVLQIKNNSKTFIRKIIIK